MSDELRAAIAAASRVSELRMLAERAMDRAETAAAERDRAVAVVDAAQELMLCIDGPQRVWSTQTEIVALRAALTALSVDDEKTRLRALPEYERGRADSYRWERNQLRTAFAELKAFIDALPGQVSAKSFSPKGLFGLVVVEVPTVLELLNPDREGTATSG